MKKTITTIILLLALVLTSFTIVGCVDNNTLKLATKELANIPSDVVNGQLEIEWVGSSSTNINNYDATKPTMIYLHGEMIGQSDKRVKLELDADVYTKDVIEPLVDNIDSNLSSYWIAMGYNVGIFHYETFADDTLENIGKKIYSASAVNFKNNGNVSTSKFNYNLTELFVAEYLDVLKGEPLTGQELRFVGNGIGANLALSIADYLYSFYEEAKISDYYLPNRIALMDPHFDNAQFAEPINYKTYIKKNPYVTKSMISYNNELILELANRGVAIEMVESDKNYETSYASDYTAKDKEVYASIRQNVQYLTFAQSYSASFPEYYLKQNRISADWYLYSINGSDDQYSGSSENRGPLLTVPILDKKGDNDSKIKFGLSAWSPTTYVASMRGIDYLMREKYWDSTESKYLHRDYTMAKYRSENLQVSTNFDKSYIVGTIFWDKNGDDTLNDGKSCRLPYVELTFVFKIDSSADISETIYVKTDSNGNYRVPLKKEYMNKSVDITVSSPAVQYYFRSPVSDVSNYRKLSMGTLGELNDSIYLYESYGEETIFFRNCAVGVRESK